MFQALKRAMTRESAFLSLAFILVAGLFVATVSGGHEYYHTQLAIFS